MSVAADSFCRYYVFPRVVTMFFEPPFEEIYTNFKKSHSRLQDEEERIQEVKESELPLIDLSRDFGHEMCEAAEEWGFFQVVNHGVPDEVLVRMREEKVKVFAHPFWSKCWQDFLGLSPNSYRWGNPRACCVDQFFWSETLHVSLSDVSGINGSNKSLRSAIDEFATKIGSLTENIAEVLAQNLGAKPKLFQDMCPRESSFVRLNRYPPCPFSSEVFGLLPHTDSDLLTIVSQDNIGGLQILKDGTWFSVKPNHNALVVNIGDLFQAMSNDTYKSIKHRVVAHKEVERYSFAYFYCPYKDAVIESCTNLSPPLYKKFSFHEYKLQIYDDVQATGNKIGLSRFRL